MSSPRRDPIIEFVGLPGAGKSTIARALREAYPQMRGPQVPAASRRVGWDVLASAVALFLSLRPFAANDPNRCAKLLEAYYVYRHGLGAPILLEQGLIQRLWSAVVDRRRCPPARLSAFASRVAKAGPDLIISVTLPPDVAAARILARPRGNSRYERMAEAEIIARMGPASRVYETLLTLWRAHSPAEIVEISGEDPVAQNVERLHAIIRRKFPGLEGSAA